MGEREGGSEREGQTIKRSMAQSACLWIRSNGLPDHADSVP